MRALLTTKKILKESVNFRSYWRFKLFWGLLLFVAILFTFNKYYDDARVRGVKVTSVVTGLEYLKQEKQDDALKMTLNDAKTEIIKWIKEFKVFEIIPPGCYDVVLYTSADPKDKKILYTLYLREGEILELKEKKIIDFFNAGKIEFRQGFISITYSFNDYCRNVLLPTFFFEFFVLVLITLFILKDKEKLENITEIQENQRFKSLVHLTAGIAHNFRNDLSVIYGQTELLKKEAEARPPVRPYERYNILKRVKTMTKVIDDMTNSINKIINFSKEDLTEKEDINIIEMLDCSIEMFYETLKEKKGVTKIYFKPEYDKILCKGKRQSYNTVFFNILNNAHQAMENNANEKTINVCLEIKGEILVIRFIDNGCGMTDETRRMAFIPFYTVNKTAGTGLGLSTSRTMIEQADGKIEIENTIVGKGTIIKIELPIFSM